MPATFESYCTGYSVNKNISRTSIALKKHLSPKPNVLTKQHKFFSKHQHQGRKMNLAVVLITCAVIYTVQGGCPAGTCSESQTCCDTTVPGEWGCCPQPNAVCCSDGLHCCPHDMVCNLDERRCDAKNGLIHPLLIKDPPADNIKSEVVKVANKVDIIYCPGGYYYCQDGATCCPLPNGAYSCCPYLSASCCADMIHCCPYGTRCDATSKYCLRGNNLYQALMKKPAFPMN